MKRSNWLALTALLIVNAAPSLADDLTFRGSIECVGPYEQPQLHLPVGSIQVSIAWDPVFRNSDVKMQYGKFNGTGTALFSWVRAFYTGGPETPYLDGHHWFSLQCHETTKK